MATVRWGRVLSPRGYLSIRAGVVTYALESTVSTPRRVEGSGSLDLGAPRPTANVETSRRTANVDYLGGAHLDYLVGQSLSIRGGLEAIRHRYSPNQARSAYTRTGESIGGLIAERLVGLSLHAHGGIPRGPCG